MLFMGTYTPKLDEKGRLFLPAKFRDRLSEGLVVTQGQENCLVVWPSDVFDGEADRAASRPMTNRAARRYARVLFAGGDEATPDKQGRIGIPAHLRDYAALRAGRRGDRRPRPAGDLEPRPLAGVPGRRMGDFVGPRRGRRLIRSGTQPASRQHNSTAIRRTRSLARSRCLLGHLPRHQTAPAERAGDLARRIVQHESCSSFVSRGQGQGVEPMSVISASAAGTPGRRSRPERRGSASWLATP